MKKFCLVIFSLLVLMGCQGGGASPDSNSPASVDEIVKAAVADKAAWKDKKVTATGYVFADAKSGDIYTLTISDDKNATSKKYVICVGKGSVADELKNKSKKGTFTGTVNEIEGDRRVHLKDCTIGG